PAGRLARGDYEPRVDALRPALERRRAAVQRAHDPVAHRDVVADDVELGHRGGALGGREDHPVRAAHPQLPPTGLDVRVVHAPEFYAVAGSAAGIPVPRRPGSSGTSAATARQAPRIASTAVAKAWSKPPPSAP